MLWCHKTHADRREEEETQTTNYIIVLFIFMTKVLYFFFFSCSVLVVIFSAFAFSLRLNETWWTSCLSSFSLRSSFYDIVWVSYGNIYYIAAACWSESTSFPFRVYILHFTHTWAIGPCSAPSTPIDRQSTRCTGTLKKFPLHNQCVCVCCCQCGR